MGHQPKQQPTKAAIAALEYDRRMAAGVHKELGSARARQIETDLGVEFGIGTHSLRKAVKILRSDRATFDRLAAGEFPNVTMALAAANIEGSRRARKSSIDGFEEAVKPLMQYLEHYDGHYPHVAPGLARMRIRTIDKLTAALRKKRDDLVPRSSTARLTMHKSRRKSA